MTTERRVGYAPLTTEIAGQVARLGGPCIGCKECVGLCTALIDTLVVPDTIVRRDN